jgi:lamin tail-like protein
MFAYSFRRFTLAFIIGVVLVCLGGAPLSTLATSTSIVISEFRTRGPNGGNDEFIELYNPSSSPTNIGGWVVKGSNSAGTVSTRAIINSGTVLSAHCHYLLTNSNPNGGPYSGSTLGDQTLSALIRSTTFWRALQYSVPGGTSTITWGDFHLLVPEIST